MKNYVYIVFLCFITTSYAQLNELQKVQLHQVSIATQPAELPQLELGKLVCYFRDKPLIQSKRLPKSIKKGWEGHSYFFPLTQLSESAQSMFRRVNNNNNAYYKIQATQVSAPQVGIRVDVNYDPKYISCNCDTFDAITTQKGVVVRLINEQFLKKLSGINRPLLQTAMNKKPHVAIDCGHGGNDFGTIGCNNVPEKNVTLQVGLQVAHLLRSKGFSVALTRADDSTLDLHERTDVVHKELPQVFLSIHANSAANKQANGIETYCLDGKLFSVADTTDLRVRKQLDQLYAQSNVFARTVHQQVMQTITASNPGVRDRHVRHSVAQLLLGTNVPSALIELGFLSNQHEASNLIDKKYQHKLAKGICDGICTYFGTSAT